MRRSSEPEERAQFTVAELLARYGESAPPTARRHRRAAEEPAVAADAVAQPVVERNWADNREPVVRPSGPSPVPDSLTQPHLNGRARQEWAPAVSPPPALSGRAPVTPPAVARRVPLTRTVAPDDPVTEQLPRLDPALVAPPSSSSYRPVRAEAGIAQSGNAQPPAGLDTATRAIPEQDESVIPADEAPEASSPMWEWALVLSQVGIGVVGGAALWLICEWLWQRIPVVALIVALAVITGLVWVVRRVRCAEDLQTTVIAVLVGLFVTVSPAALLLVGR